MANDKKLIYADDARRAILETDPKLAYCIERIKGVDAVEVVHGLWIEHPNVEILDGKWISNYECSECCCFYRTHENYCGYCGAKMDGDGNA